MTLTVELKTCDDKIKANQDQYSLDKEAAKISALSSKELDKYEYFTDEDLGYKGRLVEQAKFEYSSFAKVFNKGLEKGFWKDLEILKMRMKSNQKLS